jgi:hypothetical protein
MQQALGVAPLGPGADRNAPPPGQMYGHSGNYGRPPPRLPGGGGYQQGGGGGAPLGGKYNLNPTNVKLPSLGPQGHRVDSGRGGQGGAGGGLPVDYRPSLPPLLERN